MSLRRNVVASIASQLYVTLAGIVAVPLYIKYMGAEAYGLIGFFSVLQTWFILLDAGLTATMGRETARFHGGATDALSYRRLTRAVEGIFLVVGVAGSSLLFLGASVVAHHWLGANRLPDQELTRSVQLMAPAIGLRWLSGLYRGTVTGAERLVWLGVFNIGIATLRFVGVVGALALLGGTPTIFFSYQLGVALFELALLVTKTYALLPAVPVRHAVPWSWGPLKPVLKFSLMSALASLASAAAGQADKLVLSKVLPLADYGYFTLAVLAAGGVSVVVGPVSAALSPRLTRLEAEGQGEALVAIYRQATQFVAVVAGAASITLAFRAESLLFAWTGDAAIAARAAPILRLYALGNGLWAVDAFQYLLQYAHGNLRLHVIGNVLFPTVVVPAVIWTAHRYGAAGAGYVWLATNLLTFAAWVSFVHSRFAPGLNAKWYTQDTTFIFVALGAAGYALNALPTGAGRVGIAVYTVVFGALVAASGACASSMMRSRLQSWTTLRQKWGA